MKKEQRIRISGRPKEQLDMELLVQAILLITEQRLREQDANGHGRGDAA